jgi:methylmalonyl-CoA mutase cobalamin-binding domain/chain
VIRALTGIREVNVNRELVSALGDLDVKTTRRLLDERISANENPWAVLEDLRLALDKVGERYSDGEYFLGELILAGETFRECATKLEPLLRATGNVAQAAGRVVIATPRGDIHDLGKNIVCTMLRASGFDVHDLGVDCGPRTVLDAVQEVQPHFVCFSILMTPIIEPLKQVIAQVRSQELPLKPLIMIGGGITTEKVREYVGADFQTTNASDAVRYCKARMEDFA